MLKEDDKDGNVVFHKGRNPISAVKKAYPYVKFVINPSASLSLEQIKRGFEKMGAKERRKWLKDIQNGNFQLRCAGGEQEAGNHDSDSWELDDAASAESISRQLLSEL